MPSIFETTTIKADIETVFDLISRIEDFPLYARALKEVRKVDHETYRWCARARGFSLTWDSVITEYKHPTRLAWRSIRGFDNSGAYHRLASHSIQLSQPRPRNTDFTPGQSDHARPGGRGVGACQGTLGRWPSRAVAGRDKH
jgi:hypothetical protein